MSDNTNNTGNTNNTNNNNTNNSLLSILYFHPHSSNLLRKQKQDIQQTVKYWKLWLQIMSLLMIFCVIVN